MVQGHSRPVESGSRKDGGSDGISGGVPGDGGGSPDRMEVAMNEEVCPMCSGTGEAGVGWGDCYECGGDGVLREIEDYEDLVAMSDEWERGME